MANNEKRITDFPAVTEATLNDYILAAQNYISPTNPGTSVKETLSQVLSLFKANIILNYSGNPNGFVAGETFQLCWDTTNTILYVCVVSGSTEDAIWHKSITLTAGTGITITQAADVIQISADAQQLSWNMVTDLTAFMQVDNAYTPNNSARVELILPPTSSYGDILLVSGYGSGGWRITQGNNQQIIFGNYSTTLGNSGYLESTNQYDSVQLYCVAQNTIWQVYTGPQGSLTVV